MRKLLGYICKCKSNLTGQTVYYRKDGRGVTTVKEIAHIYSVAYLQENILQRDNWGGKGQGNKWVPVYEDIKGDN